jgi:hypothetical protein
VENAASPAESTLDLLTVMTKIADVVKQFDDPEIRRDVYDTLASTYLGVECRPRLTAPGELRIVETPADEAADDDLSPEAGQVPADPQQAAAPRTRRARRSASKKSLQRPDINFRPDGKQSLVDFAAERDVPDNFYAKNTALVFYLQHILGLTALGSGHVAQAYDAVGWTPPRDVENSLAQTASKKRWLETSDMKAIHTTHNGEHEVRYKMTKKAAPA